MPHQLLFKLDGKNMSFIVKTVSQKELKIMLDLAKEEGWNPGLCDEAAFFTIDHQGFLIGYLDDKPIACISVVKYDHHFGFLGLYIVQKAYRGKGFGLQIWQQGMQYLAEYNVGLDGVVAQQNNYKKSGFKLAHRNFSYQTQKKPSSFSHPCLIEAKAIDPQLIMEYDHAFFPCPRDKFLQTWLTMPNAQAFVYQDKGVKGYGVIRRCHVGYKIGPLFADNAEIAHILFQGLCATIQNESQIFLAIPEPNSAAIHLAKKNQMQPVLETARMYTQEIPDISLSRTFGLTTFEVG